MELFKNLPVEYVPSPNYWPGSSAGARYGYGIHTIGLHSTRSGKNYTDAQEYTATKSWFKALASTASTHALVGDTRNIALFYPVDKRYNQVPVHLTGEAQYARYAYWHAGIGAKGVALTSLGLEIPQSFLDEPFEDDAIETSAVVVGHWCQLFDIPPRYLSPSDPFSTNNKTSPLRGIWRHEWVNRSKSDPGPMFPAAEFLDMVKNYVNASSTTPEPIEDLSDVRNKITALEQKISGYANVSLARFEQIENEIRGIKETLRSV